ncbi:hypothetical protein FYJ74_06380 [Pyramidobacter sp. SM-530-WT-4B]|uniref:SF3 helicase domain-containing protein n=1 Tax=Pyramidobacter porci TaxID=2605789 RepID=A0A6L5YBU0_9BACT|nr:phage/plasmid primase, P4 family [Pyramidobacter porci]MST55659.1 hypothetical protein [Pyramidobacter porci]
MYHDSDFSADERNRLCNRCPKFKELCEQQKQGELDKKLAKLVIMMLVSAGRYPLAIEFAKKAHDKKLAPKYYRYYQGLIFNKESALVDGFDCTDFGCTAEEIKKCFSRQELERLYPNEDFSFRKDKETDEPLNSPLEMLRFFRSELPEIGIFTRWNKANNVWCPDTGNFNPNLYLDYVMSSLPIVLTEDNPPQLSVYCNGIWKQQDLHLREINQLLRIHYNRAAPHMWKGFPKELWQMLPQESPSCTTLKSGKKYVNVQNGLVYFMDGELYKRSHTDEVYTTRQVPVPIKEDCECPNFEYYLQSTFRNDEDLIKVVQEMCGYLLLDTCKAEKIFYLIGPGGNGKSVLLGVLEALLGHAQGTIGLSLEEINTNKFARFKLIGKFANLSNESEASGKDAVNLKVSRALASGNSVWVEDKGKPGFMAKLTAKQVYCMNEIMPVKNGTSQGNLRRALIIPFEQVFSSNPAEGELAKDVNLLDKLLGELPAILRWALEGAMRLIENNFEFSHSDKVEEYFKIYANAVDELQMKRFVEEKMIRTTGKPTSTTEIYNAHRLWCEQNGIELPDKVSGNKYWDALKSALKSLGEKKIEKVGCNGNRVHLKGWRLRTEDDIDIDIEIGEDTKEASTLDQIMAEMQKLSPERQQRYLDKLRTRNAEKAAKKAQSDEEVAEAESKPKKAQKAAKKAQSDEEVDEAESQSKSKKAKKVK